MAHALRAGILLLRAASRAAEQRPQLRGRRVAALERGEDLCMQARNVAGEDPTGERVVAELKRDDRLVLDADGQRSDEPIKLQRLALPAATQLAKRAARHDGAEEQVAYLSRASVAGNSTECVEKRVDQGWEDGARRAVVAQAKEAEEVRRAARAQEGAQQADCGGIAHGACGVLHFQFGQAAAHA
ncbi:hypothetical protein AURDEDRAFT_129097 [Auricularia subglabra TFB-10046 SS5]|nr:hypothetical protein AURDEDRAFT_129097 [Auricularia subglabra TFB-10046 SS5]